MNCIKARQLCSEDALCNQILHMIPHLCGMEIGMLVFIFIHIDAYTILAVEIAGGAEAACLAKVIDKVQNRAVMIPKIFGSGIGITIETKEPDPELIPGRSRHHSWSRYHSWGRYRYWSQLPCWNRLL